MLPRPRFGFAFHRFRMAALIPSLGTCASRMTRGERRLAERLEQKLDADYLVWYDVPVGPKQAHPDFVVLHPRRGLLILEVKAMLSELDNITGSAPFSAERDGEFFKLEDEF